MSFSIHLLFIQTNVKLPHLMSSVKAVNVPVIRHFSLNVVLLIIHMFQSVHSVQDLFFILIYYQVSIHYDSFYAMGFGNICI